MCGLASQSVPEEKPAKLLFKKSLSYVFFGKFSRKCFRKINSSAGEDCVPFVVSYMLKNKITMRNTVSVNKYQVIASTLPNGNIKNPCFTKANIFMPDMLYRNGER